MRCASDIAMSWSEYAAGVRRSSKDHDGLARSPLCGKGALPNGSRLSCGRLARRRKGVGRQSEPARAQHSASSRAITARQLQALVRRAAQTLRDLRVAEISQLDMQLKNGKIESYRAKVKVSFKYEGK